MPEPITRNLPILRIYRAGYRSGYTGEPYDNPYTRNDKQAADSAFAQNFSKHYKNGYADGMDAKIAELEAGKRQLETIYAQGGIVYVQRENIT